ncbi:MAG: RNA polymerase sigma factor [Gemmatimonadota bacterium]
MQTRSSLAKVARKGGVTTPTDVGSTDAEGVLVERARNGDLRAFEALYHLSSPRVMALCARMVGDRKRASDLTHDAFVRAWEKLGSYRGESSFSTWMHRLTVNVVLGAIRVERRHAGVALDQDDDSVDPQPLVGASCQPADVLSRIDIERAIAGLPTNARMVFVLHDVEGYRHEEIAERMELAPGTIRAHLHRARQLLMRALSR